MHTLDTEAVQRLLQLAESPYRPRVIQKLQEEIEGAIRVAELRATVTHVVDDAEAIRIVGMKFRLDGLYVDWIEGRLS